MRWLAAEVRRLGVTVRTGLPATAEVVASTRPDIVVLATGARTTAPPWALGCPDRVVGVREVVDGSVAVDGHVAIIDDEHRSQGLSAAIAAAARGCRVTFFTRTPGPCELDGAGGAQRHAAQPARAAVRDPSRPQSGGDPRQRGRVRCASRRPPSTSWSTRSRRPGPPRSWTWTGSLPTFAEPNDELFAELRAGHDDVRLVGDVLAPHRIEAAVHAGFDLAAAI